MLHPYLRSGILLAIIIFSYVSCEPKSGHNQTTNEIVTPGIERFVTDHLNGWTIADTSDYATSWWSFYDKDYIPYVAVTDINDDQQPDYGLIVKKSDSVGLALLISTDTSYQYWIDKEVNNDQAVGIHSGLSHEAPGRIDCIVNNEERSLILKSNGITLTDFEIRSRVYYWSDSGLQIFKMVE